MVQADLRQLLIKPVKSFVSKEAVEKPSDLLKKPVGPSKLERSSWQKSRLRNAATV